MFFALSLLLLGGACSDDSEADADGDVQDIADADVGIEPDAAPGPDAPVAMPDGAVEPQCGTEVLPVAQITGTEGLAIAPDGTLYYSQNGKIGRRRPGTAPENAWVDVGGTTTIFGLVYDDASGMLYVAAPSLGGAIWKIDTIAATPAATILYSPAPSANGIVIGPDGAIYYSSLGDGSIYRVDLAGTRTEVTTTDIPGGPNGIFFENATTLLAVSYNGGVVYSLTLGANMKEVARSNVGDVGGKPDGIALDEQGRWYIGDNTQGRLLRYAADWTGEEILLTDLPAAANVVFGRGTLDCADVYVASGGALGRYHIQ